MRVVSLIYFFLIFLVFCLLRAAPAAYGGSQARGLIRAVATGLTRATATSDPSCICDLHHSSGQRWILNPLSNTRARTHVLMDTSRVLVSMAAEWKSELCTMGGGEGHGWAGWHLRAWPQSLPNRPGARMREGGAPPAPPLLAPLSGPG